MQKFKNTSEIEPLRDFLGPDRAITAMELGLRIDNPAYNIYVAGNPGTGKSTYNMQKIKIIIKIGAMYIILKIQENQL